MQSLESSVSNFCKIKGTIMFMFSCWLEGNSKHLQKLISCTLDVEFTYRQTHKPFLLYAPSSLQVLASFNLLNLNDFISSRH